MRIFEHATRFYQTNYDPNTDLGVNVFVTLPSRYRTVMLHDEGLNPRAPRRLLFPATCFKVMLYRTHQGFYFVDLHFGILKKQDAKTVYGLQQLSPSGFVCMTRFGADRPYNLKPLVENSISYFWSSSFYCGELLRMNRWQKIKDSNELFENTGVIWRIPPDSEQIYPRKWVV